MSIQNVVIVCGLVIANWAMAGNAFGARQNQQSQDKEKSAASQNDALSVGNSGATEPQGAADSDQGTQSSTDAGSSNSGNGIKAIGKDFLLDQKQILTSPARLRLTDAQWLVPLGGFTAALFATDSDFSRHQSHNPTTISHYKTLSDAGVGALIGAAGGLWLFSFPNHNEHWREAGWLSGEAAINSLVDVEALKYSLRRQRPYQGNGTGPFFQSGGSSFPSEHAAAAWSIAGVLAHEYPGPFTKILVYGLASLVSFSRVRAHQHFPSDVLVGSVMGDFIGQDIYSRRHDVELGGADWESVSQFFREHWKPSPNSFGSPFVPLDSWIYPAIERLAAMNLVNTEFAGIRPWTRLECANLTQQASDNIDEKMSDSPAATEANEIVHSLQAEFTTEYEAIDQEQNSSTRLESVYTRSMDISGKPLVDSYHFGQTVYNDNGRPYQEGFNNVTGFSAYGIDGRFAIYVDGEYQHAPSAPAYPAQVRQVIAKVDMNPLQPATPFAEVNQFALLDAYASTNIEGWDLSFGRQPLWWGPSYGSSFLFSDNAEPIYMFRLSRVMPVTIPLLGPVKVDLFFGRPQGNEFPARPLVHGEKVSFKPTKNLELGFSRTTEFGGIGRPMTLGAIWNSYVAFSSSFNYSASQNPGKRTGGFDFSYRVPFVRDWLTLYTDAMSNDDPNPLDAPRRGSFNPGIYLSRIPGLPKLDFRVEGIYDDVPTSRSNGGQFAYWEAFYHDNWTNKNFIMGSWLGREGKGGQAWLTYWFNPKSSLQFGYRNQKVASDFIPGGETLHDGSAKLSFWPAKICSISTLLQYEQWKAPLLATDLQRNWTSSVQITFWPPSWRK